MLKTACIPCAPRLSDVDNFVSNFRLINSPFYSILFQHSFSTYHQKNVEKSDGVYIGCDISHGAGHVGIGTQQLFHLADGGEDGGVVSALIL